MTELFSALLKASFQGSIVIVAVLILRLLLKNAPKSVFCLLWLLAGLRLVLPFEIESSFSLQPRLDEAPLSIQVQQPVQVPDILVQEPEGEPLEVLPPQTPTLPEGYRAPVQSDSFLYKVEDGAISPLTRTDIAAWVWLLGMGIMLTASVVSYLRLKRRVREAYLMENGCFECPGLDTAFVLGFLPPKIYLPMGLSEEEKKFIFDHENTHIARHDHWYKLLGYAVLSIHWFNPLVWIAYALLCRDIELACDEHVVKYMSLSERKAYSAALLSCSGHTAGLAACPVAFGESNPKQRILNVLNYKRPGFWISLLAVIAVIFVAVCLMTSPGDEENREVEGTPEEWMQQIEETLYTIQAPDAYAIIELRSFGGSAAPMDQHQRQTYRYGENRFRWDTEEGSGEYQGWLCLNGSCFSATAPETSFDWQPDTSEDVMPDPWLYSFDLSGSDAQVISRQETEEGYTLRLLVHEPYEDAWIQAEEYYVDFCFDREDQFLRAMHHAETMTLTVTTQMLCQDLPGSSIRSTIEDYAGSGIAALFPGVWEGETVVTGIGIPNPSQEAHDVKLILNTDGTGAWEFSLDGELIEGLSHSFTYRVEGDELLFQYAPNGEERVPFQLTLDTLHLEGSYNMTLYRTPDFLPQANEDGYLELCRSAVLELQGRMQFHLSETLAYFTGDREDSRSDVSFWQDETNWLRQSYVNRFRENRNHLYYDDYLYYQVQGEEGDPTWSRLDAADAQYGLPWLCLLQWDNQLITFNGAGWEGTELRVSVTVHSTPPTLGWSDVVGFDVLFFFDQSGNLTRAIMTAVRENIKVIDDLKIEATSAANIRGKIEWLAAQRTPEVCIGLPLAPEVYLQLCRTALENYRTQGSWVVLVDRQFSGLDAMNESSSQLWYIHGEDWLQQTIISESDFHQENWYLKKDDASYSRESVVFHNPANGENHDSGWQAHEDLSGWALPWPLEFDWDNADITFIENTTDGTSDVVTFRVQGSPLPSHFKDVAEYDVSFWLRPSGAVWKMELRYTETWQMRLNGEDYTAQVHTVTTIDPNASAPEEAEKMIALKYQEISK